MEPNTGKALHRAALKLKRPVMPPKRMQIGRHKGKLTNASTHIGQSLVKRYMKFKKSGKPERLMFYKNGEWIDFPKAVVDLVKNDLEVKKAVVEVQANDFHLVLDFFHMCHTDLKTGLQQPISWIDETGRCFFPEVYGASDEEPYDFCKQDGGKSYDSTECHEIKLHLDIEISGADRSKLVECSGESNAFMKHVQIDAEQTDDSINEMNSGNVGEGIEKNRDTGLGLDAVRKMFLEGMNNFGITDDEIADIYRYSSMSMQARLELFLKQAEITKKIHADANVCYAWLASSKRELSTMMEYGLGHCGLSASKLPYSIGINLAAVTRPGASARYCDVDENGVRHLVLCRVIMGNMEIIRPGSCQFHPSRSAYDNGVDDIQNPTYYIVWNMNVNTHIYPEFVVSFKLSVDAEGQLCGSGNNNVSGVNVADQGSTVDTGKARVSKLPGSPWLPFSLLFSTLKRMVHPEAMELIQTHYERFVSRKISRHEFVRRMRYIVGDPLLREALASHKSKIPSTGESSNRKEA